MKIEVYLVQCLNYSIQNFEFAAYLSNVASGNIPALTRRGLPVHAPGKEMRRCILMKLFPQIIFTVRGATHIVNSKHFTQQRTLFHNRFGGSMRNDPTQELCYFRDIRFIPIDTSLTLDNAIANG